MSYILLVIGFILLIKGADKFVECASSIARHFGISSLIIGLTIVAMGTSAPELSVSLSSSLLGMNDISIANVVGSNIFNILIITGISAMIYKLKINNYSNLYTLLGVCVLLLLLSLDCRLSIFDGIIMLIAFVCYLFRMIKLNKTDNNNKSEKVQDKPLFPTICIAIISLVCIIYGGNMVVNSASDIALVFGMSENLIGLTIVALGTSLPEFVTSVIATKKGELDIAVGNVIGSNIFNILLILGCASAISPMNVSLLALLDIIIMNAVTLLFILLTVKSKDLCKRNGIILILIYIIYIAYTIVR